MKIISREELERTLTAEDALASQREAFLALHRGELEAPARARFDWPAIAARTLVMPVLSAADRRLALKIVQVSDHGPVSGLLMVFDSSSGEARAIMDAEPITLLRTAAASALSADLLAPKDSATLAMFGAGAQAAAHIRMLGRVRPIREVRICARRREASERLASALGRQLGIAVRSTSDAAQALAGAEIVCCCTPSTTPLFAARDVASEAHIIAIGAFRKDMVELPPELFSGAFVCVDQLSAAASEAGDLCGADAAGYLDWRKVQELGALLERPPGRRPAPRTIFKSVGLAIQDYMLARRIVDPPRS